MVLHALRSRWAQDSLRRDCDARSVHSGIAKYGNHVDSSQARRTFHHFDPNDSNCIEYEPIVHILCGSSKRKTSPKKGVTSPRRHRIHRSKAELLGFTGDEKLHEEYVVFST